MPLPGILKAIVLFAPGVPAGQASTAALVLAACTASWNEQRPSPSVFVVVLTVIVVPTVIVVVVVGMSVVVGVVVRGPAHAPSELQASNLLNSPNGAPHAIPFLHFEGDPTIDALTLPFFFRTQHTAALGLPQMDAFSHFLMSFRHCFCGMRAVRLASLSVLRTHFL